MLVCVLSNRTSPGATSVAVGLGMVWANQGRAPVLAECDPGGGVIGLRFGMAERPSLATFASDSRRGASASNVGANVQPLHGMQCLLGPADPRVARRAVQSAAPNIAQLHGATAEPWICDLGRIAENSAVLEIARNADLVLVVTRTSVAEVQALVFGVGLLRSQDCELGLVCIGESPNPPREIAELTDIPLLGVLPDEASLASAFSGGQFNERQLRKSALWRSVVHLAGEVENAVADAAPAAETPAAHEPAPLVPPPLVAPAPPSPAAAPAPPASITNVTPPPVPVAPITNVMSPPAPPAPAAPAPPAPAAPASPSPAPITNVTPPPAYDEVQVWTAANAPEMPPHASVPPPPAPAPQFDETTDPFAAPTQRAQPARPRFDDEDDITIPRRIEP